MSKQEEMLSEVNELLRAYNYLDEEDKSLNLEEIPSLVSHLLLLRIFTHEGMKFGVPYEEVEDFCEFAIDLIYEKENSGEDVSAIDIEDIIDAYRSQGVKH